MKKVSLLTVAVSLATAGLAYANAPVAPAACCPKAFQGFHVGGNIGYDTGWGKFRSTDTERFPVGGVASSATEASRHTLGLRGVKGGIGTGYLVRCKQWGIGIAFDANWANTSGKNRDLFTTTPAGRRAVHIGKARLKNSLELYGKLGYVLCGEQVMPFVGLGWANAKWSQSTVDVFRLATGAPTVVFKNHHSKRFNALLWKMGVDFLATKHVVLGFEYTGTNAGSKSRTVNTGTVALGRSATNSFRPQTNTFSLTARIVY